MYPAAMGERTEQIERLRRLVVETRRPGNDGISHQRRSGRWRQLVLSVLKTKALAAGLSPLQLEHSLRRALITKFSAGHEILLPGDSPDFLSVVCAGAVKTVIPWAVYDPAERPSSIAPTRARRLTVQFAKPSYVFGLMPLARGERNGRFGAIAHSDALVAVMSRDLMASVLAQAPAEARMRFIAYCCRAISRLICAKCQLLALDVPDRLLQELTQLARDFPLNGTPGGVDLPLSQHDLAELVGASRFSIIRALRSLAGLVRYEGRRFIVAPDLLAAPAHVPGRRSPARGFAAGDEQRAVFQRQLIRNHERMGLSREAVYRLANGAELRSFDAEDVIDVDDQTYATVLVEGAVRVNVEVADKTHVGVWIAKPGHFVGAGWVGTGHDRNPAFCAVAHGPCVVAFVRLELMARVVEVLSPEELLHFLGYCYAGLSQHLFDKCVLLPMSTPERLLYQLQVLARDFPCSTAEGTIIDLPLRPRRDLAPLIASNPWSLGRALVQLKRAERIRQLSDGRFLVLGYVAAHAAA